jgi:hypothetical protein
MRVTGAVPQLRTTNIEESIDFYTRVMSIFNREVKAYAKMLKSKRVTFLSEPHDTNYTTNDFTIQDNQGHVLGFGEAGS